VNSAVDAFAGVSKLDRCKSPEQLGAILQYLKAHGERLDSEITAGIGSSLECVCIGLSELSDRGDVIMCRTTRFTEGRPVEGMLCRVSGYSPPAGPGRKPKAL
jgi:hypothetical protein